MSAPSPWRDNFKIAIHCWARERARQVRDQARKVPERELEQFLAELLNDTLLTFNDEYQRAYNGYVERMWWMLENSHLMTPPLPVLFPVNPKAKE